MLKFKQLKLSNIGPFVGEHTIQLDSQPYLLQVDAENRNTGGSSGSGKTTIFNAIEFLLNLNQIPATVLQSRLTKDPISVTGVFDFDGTELVITRSKTSGLMIAIDGVDVVSGNNKMGEERLDEILGIPRDLLRKMIHKRQKEGGFFLNLSPKESHTFLADTLNLKFWTEKQLLADQEAKAAQRKSDSLKIALQSLKESVIVSKKSLDSLQEPTIDFGEDAIQVLERQAYQARHALEQKQKELELKILSIDKPVPPVGISRSSLVPLRNKIAELKAQEDFERKKAVADLESANSILEERKGKIASIKAQLERVPSLTLELDDLKKKIITLHSHTCPTCNQKWHAGSDVELGRLVEIARKKKAQIEEIEKGRLTLQELESSLPSLQKELDNIKQRASQSSVREELVRAEAALAGEIAALDQIDQKMQAAYLSDLEKARQKEQEIRLSFGDELTALTYNKDMFSELLVKKRQELDSYLANKSNFDRNKETLTNALNTQTEQLRKLEKEQEEALERAEVAADAAKVLKSYINSLFQDTLDSIAEKASAILSRIPNMQTASIYFEGFKETKSGSIKEEITAILTMDNEIGIPVKSMSGGERTAVDLAVDLAVIDIVEERAGKGLDLFILDEPFDGLDAVCREQCLEVLKTHISDKRIIVVDHSNETKEMVEGRILVIKDGQESHIGATLV